MFYLKNLDLIEFNGYEELIRDLANSTLKPGAKVERLNWDIGIDIYSARRSGGGRLVFTVLKEGSFKGRIVLLGADDEHNYARIERKFKGQPRHQKIEITPYPLMEVSPVDAVVSAAEEALEKHYIQFDIRIQLDDSQKEVLETTLPAIIHGAPGTGKTLIGVKIVMNYLQDPIVEDDVDEAVSLKALFLFPTSLLAQKTKENYLAECGIAGFDPALFELVDFLTYEDFFVKHTREGQAIRREAKTGFTHFKDWYQERVLDKPKIEGTKLSAEDCWASFRICSLYTNVVQYQALREHQCKVPLQSRQIIYALYCDYKAVCEAGGNYSLWVNPFQCDGQYGLVVADEAHTQSGATLSSLYKIAKDGRFVALVGDHQNLSAHPSLYDGGPTAADLLSIKIHAHSTITKVNTHTLTNTHRNSEKVVNVVNFFVEAKKRIGLKTVFKGADFSLNGNNDEVGEAQIVSPRDSMELKERFMGKPDVAILVPESHLAEARARWPNNTVFSAMGALGLEFPYVICEGLLTANQRSLNVGKLLKDAPTEVPKEGHLSKHAIPPEVSEQAPWFSNLITACSRART